MLFGEIIDKYLDRDIVIADVGCRWGFSDCWKALAPAVKLYGFDPDEDECKRITASNPESKVTLVPKALGRTSGKQTLFQTREPACSSIYQPDPKLTAQCPELNCASLVGTSEVYMTTLDEWAQSEDVPIIDFLKLDVQGAELDVLIGGEASLKNVRALEVEVEFNPIYLDQPLFGDVDAFLRKRGFVLWRLSNLVHYSEAPEKYPNPFQDVQYFDSKPVMIQPLAGQLVWGHAHYIRREAADGGTTMNWEQCLRDGAILKVLGFTDLASRLLESAISKGPKSLAEIVEEA